MKNVVVQQCHPFFLEEVHTREVIFDEADYRIRINALVRRMNEKGMTHTAFYADREHFASIQYFSGYDCRFEEALLIFDAQGNAHIIVGNEGISQTYPIPYDVSVYLYQNFSLQGQPRDKLESLQTILSKIGLNDESKVGLVGFKYFEAQHIDSDPAYTFDIPAYVVNAFQKVSGESNVVNFTKEITGFPDGIRTVIRTAKEIAWAESAGNKASGVILRMLKRLKPGLSELELGYGVAGLEATNVYPMINFGAANVRVGVKSPSERVLSLGEVCGFAYSVRGHLASRVGIAAYDANTVSDELKPHLAFYENLWHVVADLLQTIRVGTSCASMHDLAIARIGGQEYGLSLNVTHYTGADEWLNSPVFEGSPYSVNDGAYIQIDVIASNPNPVRTAICEDCIIVAGKELREKLRAEYPQVYERIVTRQKMMREHLGIAISDDCLPMSNLTGVYFPFMLNLDRAFALQ